MTVNRQTPSVLRAARDSAFFTSILTRVPNAGQATLARAVMTTLPPVANTLAAHRRRQKSSARHEVASAGNASLEKS
jgi:hypothetical protein